MDGEANRELARRFVDEVLIGEDPAAVDALVGSPALAATLKAAFALPRHQRTFTDDRVEFQEIVADGDTVVVVARATNRHTGLWFTERFGVIEPTFATVSVPLVLILKIADGKIAAYTDVGDMYGLLEQVGALPACQAEALSSFN